MIEKTVLDYLNGQLSVPAYMEMPEKQPPRYVLIEKTGGYMENFIFFATVVLQSYAETLYEAAALNEEVKAAMNEIIALDTVLSSRLNADYNFTDTEKKKYRYQAVYDLVY